MYLLKMYLLLLAGFAAVCTASHCPTIQYTAIHGSYAASKPALGSLDDSLASKVPAGQASYRLSVQRSDVATVCSMVHNGKEFKTYVPLKIDGDKVRMIKPVAQNTGCRNAAKGKSFSKLQLLFKLLDSAQVGVVTCEASHSTCHVHLYQSTVTDGYHKERTPLNSTSTPKPGHGRKLR